MQPGSEVGARGPPPLAGRIRRVREELLLQDGDPHVGRVEFATQELGVVHGGFGVEGERLELQESLAKTIDFQGPAGLVGFLAMLGQGCGLAERVEFAFEFLTVGGRMWGWLCCVTRVSEESVDTRDATSTAEAFF